MPFAAGWHSVETAGQRLHQLDLPQLTVAGTTSVHLQDDVAVEGASREVLQQLGDRLRAPAGDQVLVLRAAAPVGQVHVAEPVTPGLGQLQGVRARGRGDLVVRILVETPTKLSKEQKAILEQFRDTETGDECPASKGFFSRLKDLFEG